MNSRSKIRDQSERRKRERRATPLEQEPNQRLDESEAETPMIPRGFLSPSVKEYLELGKSIPGRAGVDYPILAAVPYTNFYCDEQPYPGFFADVETRCQGPLSMSLWKINIDVREAFNTQVNNTQFFLLLSLFFRSLPGWHYCGNLSIKYAWK